MGTTFARTKKWTFAVDRSEIHYLRFTLESYDGMAVLRTLDPGSGLIEVRVAPGCEPDVRGLIDALRVREGLALTRLYEG